jgi:hypothetical protein
MMEFGVARTLLLDIKIGSAREGDKKEKAVLARATAVLKQYDRGCWLVSNGVIRARHAFTA